MADQKLSALGTIVPDYLYGIAGGVSGKVVPGVVLMSSGTITDPVEFLDFDLPDGYTSFTLEWGGLSLDPPDIIAQALSFDGGDTFLNDIVNNDSYSNNADVGNRSLATCGDLGGTPVDGYLFLSLEVFPGNSVMLPAIVSTAVDMTGAYGPQLNSQLVVVNPSAIITPSPIRANLVRFLPFGNGDCNPPTSGHHIISGSWTLFGVPTP